MRFEFEKYKVTGDTVTPSDVDLLQDTILGVMRSAPDPGLQYTANPPQASTWAGQKGAWAFDSSYLYLCVALNTWRRVAISSW